MPGCVAGYLTGDVVLSSRRDATVQLRQHITERHGGVRKYLLAAGMTATDLAHIRCNLLRHPSKEDLALVSAA